MTSAPVISLRPLKRPAAAATVGLAVSGVLAIVDALVVLFGPQATAMHPLTVHISIGSIASSHTPVLEQLETITLLGTAVAFIVWLYRARVNLDRFGLTDVSWGRGWTIGAWFIPVVNLVMPARVVGQVYARSQPGAARVSRVPREVMRWWLLFILGLTHYDAWTPGADGLAHRTTGANAWLLMNDVALAAAAVLAIGLVRRITAFQTAWTATPESPIS